MELAVVVSLILIGDLCYPRFYQDLLSVTLLSNAWQLPTVSHSVTALLDKRDSYFLFNFPVWFVLFWLAWRQDNLNAGILRRWKIVAIATEFVSTEFNRTKQIVPPSPLI